jgi:hypothetical protein
MFWLKFSKNYITILFILLALSLAIFPLFHKGFFVTDDGGWMIIRFSSFYQALADGQFPVRFLHRLNFDYGYPVATFLYPGFMYFGVPFHLLKIGFVETIKIILGLSLFGTTLFTYFWLDKVFKNKTAAIIGSMVSLYIPYHLYDVYVRGSVGEVFALLWVPFILWMIEKRNMLLMSIGIFLLLISHNTIALLFLPLLFFYAFLRKAFPPKILSISFVFGILMSSFFIIPAVFELQYTNFQQTIVSNPANYFADFSLIGVITFLIFIFAGSLFIFQKKSQTDHDSLIQLFLIVTFFAVFLSSSWSTFLWHFIPSSFIQFPFRLLSYLVISVAFLAAFIVSKIQSLSKKIIVIIGILFLLLISSYGYGAPREFIDKDEGFYSTNEATTTVQDEYMPAWVKEKPMMRAEQKIELMRGEAKIENIFYNNKNITFDVNAKNNVLLRINTIYWPGWEVFVDNKKIEISYNNPKGVIELKMPKGNHQVTAEFSETRMRLFADIISIISFLLLILYSAKLKYKT